VNHHRQQLENYRHSSTLPSHGGAPHYAGQQNNQFPTQPYVGGQQMQPFNPCHQLPQHSQFSSPNYFPHNVGYNNDVAQFLPTNYHPSPYPNHNTMAMGNVSNQNFRRFGEHTGLQSFLRANQAGISVPLGYPNLNFAGGATAAGANQGGNMLYLPQVLATPKDNLKVSTVQVLLRQQIEVFQATQDDVTTHTRGRNKPVAMRQVGIRCRHCAHLPVMRRQKGSTYFPASTLGIYQAAQNMSTTHIQCGLCPEMPQNIKDQFVNLLAVKMSNSGAGRPYWAESARQMGLVDTEEGIFFIRDLPPGIEVIHPKDIVPKRKTSKRLLQE
jgi:hypothetical protein